MSTYLPRYLVQYQIAIFVVSNETYWLKRSVPAAPTFRPQKLRFVPRERQNWMSIESALRSPTRWDQALALSLCILIVLLA